MKKLLLIITVLLILSSLVSAKLSDETLDIVNNLSMKHYGYGTIYMSDTTFMTATTDWDFVYDWTNITFDDENGILYIETNNGKWFIEMKERKGGE